MSVWAFFLVRVSVQILGPTSAFYAPADRKLVEKIWIYSIRHANWKFHRVPCCHFQIEIFGFHTRNWHDFEFCRIDLLISFTQTMFLQKKKSVQIKDE